jgi:putative endonuclease
MGGMDCQTTRKQLGTHGERIARTFLEEKGYEFIAANWRMGRQGELDLILFEPTERLVIWVEVKTSSQRHTQAAFEMALASVTPAKCQQLLKLAEGFQAAFPEWAEFPSRFDVVAVQKNGPGGLPSVHHLKNVI